MHDAIATNCISRAFPEPQLYVEMSEEISKKKRPQMRFWRLGQLCRINQYSDYGFQIRFAYTRLPCFSLTFLVYVTLIIQRIMHEWVEILYSHTECRISHAVCEYAQTSACDILFNTRNKFHFFQASMYCSVYYIKNNSYIAAQK